MDPAHVVLLLAVFIAVAAIAGYLIAVTLILKHVVNRLVTILEAVDAVTKTAQPVGPVVDDINRELDAARRTMEACVGRLEERQVPAETTAPPPDRHAAGSVTDARGAGTATAPAQAPPDREEDSPGWFGRGGLWNR